MWGQTDYSGMYYIESYNSYSSDFIPEYYMVPTINCFYNNDEDKPHLTTYKTGGDKNSIWRIEPVSEETNTYRLIHNATGKYLVVNNAIPELAVNSVKQAHRKRVHLEALESPGEESKFLFVQAGDISGIIGIRHKTRGSNNNGDGNTHFFLNPQNGNHNIYRAKNGREITNFQGIIGFYGKTVPTSGTDGTDSRWKLYSATNTCANPVIKYTDTDETQIEISYPISTDTGWKIYYTIDGSDPSDETNGNRFEISNNTTLTDISDVSKIRAIATKEGWDDSDEAVLIASGKSQLVQSKDCDAFYMVPPIADGEINATTTNIPNAAMGWQFVPAGLYCGIQYYNILDKDGKYLYCNVGSGEDDALIMKSNAEITTSEPIDRSKFRLIIQTDGSFKLISKWWAAEEPVSYFVTKKGGNNNTAAINLSNGDDAKSSWIIVATPTTPKTQFDASFASSTTSTKYYIIKSANATTYHLLPPTTEGGNATANTTGVNPKWYFYPVDDADEWIPSYHIRNGKTGEYLYFNSTDSKFYTSSNVSNDNCYKFIIAKSANTTYTDAYNVIPYALRDQTNQANNSLNRNGIDLNIGNSRATATTLWQFEEGCLEPIFEQSGDNITISYISSTTDVYYTTNGSDPTSGTLYENNSWPASEQHGIRAIAKLKNNSSVTSEEVTLLNKPEITLEDGPYPYKGTPWEPSVLSVSVGATSTSTGYSVSYSDNRTNIGDVTVNVIDNVEDYTFIWDASTSFTIIPKAVTITANDASKAYDGTALTESGFTTTALETGDTHTFTVAMTEGSTITNVGTEFNVIVTVDGTAVTTGTETAIGNYLITTANGTLTISQKSIGDGEEAADDITITFVNDTSDEVKVEHGERTLTSDDYTVSVVDDGLGYQVATVTGKGNYTGSAKISRIKLTFYNSGSVEENVKNVSAISASTDIATPDNMGAYIVTGLNVTTHEVKLALIDYVPKGVPVLLLTDYPVEICTATPITVTTPADVSRNKLMILPPGKKVEAAQVYMFHQGQFVLTTAGTLTKYKFCLENPYYELVSPVNPDPSNAPLHIVIEGLTGIHEIQTEGVKGTSEDKWFSVDGLRLNGKPTRKGLYIKNGSKIVVK